MYARAVPMPAQAQDAQAAVLGSVDEEALALSQRREGRNVVAHRGRYWIEAPRGFYQPAHWLARFPAAEASAPRTLAWGYRAALRDDDRASHGNGAVPVHLLSDVDGYTYESLPQRRQRNVRTSRKRATIVQLTGPALLRESGFEVKRSAVERTRYGSVGSRESYLAYLDQYFLGTWRLVLAGIVDGRLGGYITGTGVEGTAYVDNVWIATEALRSSIGTGLIFEFVQACRRSGEIREIAYGLHTPEDQPLAEFKTSLGFPAVRVPSRVKVNPLAAPLLRRLNPHGYYRLTGRGQRAPADGDGHGE
jgi:hypothetical protein